MITGFLIGMGLWFSNCIFRFGTMRKGEQIDWRQVFGKGLVVAGTFAFWGWVGSMVF